MPVQRTAYIGDGQGNYTYYHPDGTVERTSTTPGQKVLQDALTLVLPNIFKAAPAAAKPALEATGKGIQNFAPKLNSGRGLRIGISKANKIKGKKGTRRVFRVTYGNRKKHFFNIDLGPWKGR